MERSDKDAKATYQLQATAPSPSTQDGVKHEAQGLKNCGIDCKKAYLPFLPPCRICGHKASGLHYGVNSCEACKGFFRRSMSNGSKYKCANSEKCNIQPHQRRHCAYCRYQKCLLVGMSVDAIQTGRYTHQKKANDTREVKQLKETALEIERLDNIRSVGDEIHDKVKDSELIPVLKLHYKSVITTRQVHVMEDLKKEEEQFGLQALSHEQHHLFYKTTGIDLDNRKEAIEKWSYASRKRLSLIVKLASALPGFSQLPSEDQVSLIKASRSEAITMMIHNQFDNENRLFYSVFTSHVCPASELIKIYDDEILVDKMFTTTRDFQNLNLTMKEVLLVLGIIITFSDRVELRAKDKVDAIQLQLVECLSDSITSNHPNCKNMLAKVLGALVPIRELTIRSDKALPKIQRDWTPACHIDPFWGEFIADSAEWENQHI